MSEHKLSAIEELQRLADRMRRMARRYTAAGIALQVLSIAAIIFLFVAQKYVAGGTIVVVIEILFALVLRHARDLFVDVGRIDETNDRLRHTKSRKEAVDVLLGLFPERSEDVQKAEKQEAQ